MHTAKFEDLNLSIEIQKAVKDMGFEEATPIQTQSIPVIMEGRDVLGQAQTGTGKTASFAIPIIEKNKIGFQKNTGCSTLSYKGTCHSGC